jgi:hypothetical protein
VSNYQDRPNTGSLFPNSRKTKDTQADRTGSLDVDGVSCWLSAWEEKGEGGFALSLAVSGKDGSDIKGRGQLVAAEKRSEKSPDVTGHIDFTDGEPAGKRYEIAGWKKESSKTPGLRFLSLSIKPPKGDEPRGAATNSSRSPEPETAPDPDYDIPF